MLSSISINLYIWHKIQNADHRLAHWLHHQIIHVSLSTERINQKWHLYTRGS